ncbi:MAG: DNA primase, partial [Myxococcota bacterium]
MSSLIPNEIVERVKEVTDIVGLVSQYVSLRKSGRNHLGLCPFHQEKTPSFTVNAEKQIFYCFGCHKGGTAFDFLKEKEGLSFPEAVRELARRAGIAIPGEDTAENRKKTDLRDKVYEANELAARFYHKVLTSHPAGATGRDYVERRELGADAIGRFRVGFAPRPGTALLDALSKRGLSADLLETAGLVVRREGGGWLDRFRNRVMFPIVNMSGKVAGFGGRTVEQGTDTAKYLNSSETPVYNKSRELFGLVTARD